MLRKVAIVIPEMYYKAAAIVMSDLMDHYDDQDMVVEMSVMKAIAYRNELELGSIYGITFLVLEPSEVKFLYAQLGIRMKDWLVTMQAEPDVHVMLNYSCAIWLMEQCRNLKLVHGIE